MAVSPRVEGVAGVVGVHQVDPPGRGQYPLHQSLQRFPSRPGMAGVEHEPGPQVAYLFPQPSNVIHSSGGGEVAGSGVLDQNRDIRVELPKGLPPPSEALGQVAPSCHVPAMDHHPRRSDRRSRLAGVRQDPSAGNPDPARLGHHIHQIGGVHIDGDRGGGQFIGVFSGRRLLPAAGVGQKHLENVGAYRPGIGQRRPVGKMRPDRRRAIQRRPPGPRGPCGRGNGCSPPTPLRPAPTNPR